MSKKRIELILLWASLGSFFMMSVSFLLMPIESITILPGLLFWLGLLLGTGLMILLELRRRAFLKKNSKDSKKQRIGLLRLASNSPALIGDVALGISMIATLVSFLITKGYGAACYFSIAATMFFFCMHCVLNGRIYLYVTSREHTQQEPKNTKANTLNKRRGRK